MASSNLRYQLPKKAIKTDCPQCGPKHRKTLSRYVDTRTDELLSEIFGRCDREQNCGYHLSPYQKGPSGLSYADEVYQQWKADNAWTAPLVPRYYLAARGPSSNHPSQMRFSIPAVSSSRPEAPVYTIPDEVLRASLGHYEENRFAVLLHQRFGSKLAGSLLQRFRVGTSARWPGATVFWLIDERNRVRGGQIKQFADDWHTEKYIDREGRKRAKVSWVHTALLNRLQHQGKAIPEWLTAYEEHAERSPCLFGLPQLSDVGNDKPIAIVEAPKTAIICAAHFPDSVWLAAMAKSYLKPERLAPLRHRPIVLVPDLGALHDSVNDKGHRVKGWLTIAKQLRSEGFTVCVSDFLEKTSSEEDRRAGLDVADYLLKEPSVVASFADWFDRPGSTLRPLPTDIEPIPMGEPSDYPAEWDRLDPPGTTPTIRPLTFHQWQQQHSYFSQMGVCSLNP